MKRSGWILVGSLATLVLCAAPYGCSGKYVDAPGQAGVPRGADGATMPGSVGYARDGSRSDGTHTWSDGSGYHGDGIPVHTDGSHGDGGYIPSDGSNYPPIQGDGADYYGEGTVDQSEGEQDGATTTPEGARPDGCEADGCYFQ